MPQQHESTQTRRERLTREETLYLFTCALEEGDIEALTGIWQQAMHDSELETLLLDIQLVYQQEAHLFVPLTSPEAEYSAGKLSSLDAPTPPFTNSQRNRSRETPRRFWNPFALKWVAVLFVCVLVGSFWLLIASRQPAAHGLGGLDATSESTLASHMVIIPTGDNQGSIVALRSQDGTQIWRKATGHRIVGSTIVVQGQMVYAVSMDGYVFALRLKDGTLFWRQTITFASSPSAQLGLYDPRLFASQNFLTISTHSIGHKVLIMVLQAANGVLRWKSLVPEQSVTNPLLGMAGDTIYLTDGKVTRAIKAENQALLWQTSQHPFFPASWDGTGPLVILNGVLYGYSNAGLQALDAKDGHLIWLQSAAKDDRFLDSMLVAGNNRLFLATPFQFCAYAMDTGSQFWCTHTRTAGNTFEGFEGLVYMDGIVYVGRAMYDASPEFQIEAWDGTSGKLHWKWPAHNLLSHDRSWTFSGGHGVLYIPGANGGLYAVRGTDGHQLWFDPSFQEGLSLPAVAP